MTRCKSRAAEEQVRLEREQSSSGQKSGASSEVGDGEMHSGTGDLSSKCAVSSTERDSSAGSSLDSSSQEKKDRKISQFEEIVMKPNPRRPADRYYHRLGSDSSEVLVEDVDVDEQSGARGARGVGKPGSVADMRRRLMSGSFGRPREGRSERALRYMARRGERILSISKRDLVVLCSVISAIVICGLLIKTFVGSGGSGSNGGSVTTTVRPGDRTGPTPAPSPPSVPDGTGGRPRVTVEISLHGFLCGLVSPKRLEICINIEQGICVCLKRRRQTGRMMITVTADEEAFVPACRGRRNFTEVWQV